MVEKLHSYTSVAAVIVRLVEVAVALFDEGHGRKQSSLFAKMTGGCSIVF